MAAFRRSFNRLHFRIVQNDYHDRVPEDQFRLRLFRNLHSNRHEVAQESEASSRDNVGESTSGLTFAERCKNILAANWQGILTTVKADATGSKEQLHSSVIQYMFRNGKPVMWLQEDDLHTVNTVLDERGSLSVGHTDPPPLINSLRMVGKFPPRVVLVGDVIPLQKDKCDFISLAVVLAPLTLLTMAWMICGFHVSPEALARVSCDNALLYIRVHAQTAHLIMHLAMKELNDMIISEQEIIDQASYQVTGVLRSSGDTLNARVNGFELMLDRSAASAIYEFNIRSCNYLDISRVEHKVYLKDVEVATSDPLSPFFGALIEGINQVQTRRHGLMLFCSAFLKVNVQDAFMLSVDRKGFDVLGKVSTKLKKDTSLDQFQWNEYRFSFGTEVGDVETFCSLLVKMEEEALKHRSYLII